jgi:hypothetical protein
MQKIDCFLFGSWFNTQEPAYTVELQGEVVNQKQACNCTPERWMEKRKEY